MKMAIVRVSVILLALMLLGGTAAHAQSNPPAALPGGETVTVQVDVDGLGHRLTGTYVVKRSTDGSGLASWTFNGIFDGKPGKAYGTAIERWSSDGSVTVELTAFNCSALTLDQLPARSVTIAPGWNGLMMVAGVPLAVKGAYKAPGAGSAPLLVVTNAGRGVQPITALPNTAGPPGYGKGFRAK